MNQTNRYTNIAGHIVVAALVAVIVAACIALIRWMLF